MLTYDNDCIVDWGWVDRTYCKHQLPIAAAVPLLTAQIMTWAQMVEATASSVGRTLLRADWLPYQPDYTRCVEHFAIHAGGYAVLKGIQAGMGLPAVKMLPSFAALRDYGNTSCSTTWYVMAYMESCGGVLRGQRVLQVGMGGGMKAGVNVWRALRTNDAVHPAWRHLAATPLTEADLPRAIEAIGVDKSATTSKPVPVPAPAPAPASPDESANGKPLSRKLTVEVQAFVAAEPGTTLTDEQLADLAH